MCGRFASALPAERLRAIFGVSPEQGPLEPSAADWAARWNLAPGGSAPVVLRDRDGPRTIRVLRWGFPLDDRPPFNARIETIGASRLFGEAFRLRRCLVPATAFYEWRRAAPGREPFAFARMDGRPVALGGVWQENGFAVLTIEAGAPVRSVHDRAPLVIEEADWPLWLGEQPGEVTGLLHPAAPWTLRCWPVGAAVNQPGSEGPALLHPID